MATITIDAADWMRDKEKRLAHEEARPQIKDASDLMGPGLAATAIQVQDWSSDEAAFNGLLFSQPTAANSPDTARWWIGTVIATPDGFGTQTVREFRGALQPTDRYVREFSTAADVRSYGPWVLDI